jgi:hypothetical protein
MRHCLPPHHFGDRRHCLLPHHFGDKQHCFGESKSGGAQMGILALNYCCHILCPGTKRKGGHCLPGRPNLPLIQLCPYFKILPLPNKIILWLTALLLRLPEKLLLYNKQTRTKLGHGAGRHSTVNGLASLTLSSASMSPSMQESSSMGPLH